MVIRQPPGSRPGVSSLAIAPAIPPMTIHHSQLWFGSSNGISIALPLFSTVVQPTFIINAATRACGTSATVSRKALANVNLCVSCCTGCLIPVIQWTTLHISRNWALNDEQGNHLPHLRHPCGDRSIQPPPVGDHRRRSGDSRPHRGGRGIRALRNQDGFPASGR